MKISKLRKETQQGRDASKEQFGIDVLTGLCSYPKSISAKYFYDDKGSELFQKITGHEDYYPTKAEFNILNEIKSEIPEILNEKEIDIVELGAGDGHKSQLILKGFLDAGVKVNFYPIDISEKAMVLLEPNIKAHENLVIHGVVAEYFEGLRFVRKESGNKQLVLCLGSNIGNFNRVESQAFLRRIWKSLNHSDYLLTGFDLKKDVATLTRAYNDSAGYTREFNLNLLTRINSELGGSFKLEKFQHFGVYNPVLGAMKSYLISLEDQDVYIKELERSFHFKAFEPIHLEYSFKFLKEDITSLGEETGFKVLNHYSGSQNLFVDSLWSVIKEVQ